MKFFKDLDIGFFKDKKVLLDIDGTIAEDKSDVVDVENENKLRELISVTEKIILVSNGEEERTKRISTKYSIEYFYSSNKKPHKESIPKLETSEVVLVGDKFLTDGLAAIQNRIPFIHVKSLHGKNESFKNKFIYLLDDFIGNTYFFLKLIRPKQWIKNLLVFAPVFFAGKFYDLDILYSASLAFLAFTLTASLVYIINDFKDVDQDKLHHKKKWRPLASSNISNFYLYLYSLILGLTLAILVISNIKLLFIILAYIVFNLAYTFYFKNIPVYDIVMVAMMYVMRVLAGGFETDIYVSPWLIICTFFACLFIISAKRYAEIDNPVRKVLRFYTKESLTGILVSTATIAIFSYSIYTILVAKKEITMYSSIIVASVFFIILNDILRGNKKVETPEIYLLTNRKINFLIFIWVIIMYFAVY